MLAAARFRASVSSSERTGGGTDEGLAFAVRVSMLLAGELPRARAALSAREASREWSPVPRPSRAGGGGRRGSPVGNLEP
eukprot:3494-Eustigmatos_ZCMA.PRE.1